jgi:hypothetical protein
MPESYGGFNHDNTVEIANRNGVISSQFSSRVHEPIALNSLCLHFMVRITLRLS